MRTSRFIAAGLFVVVAVLVVEAQQPGTGFGFTPPSLYVTTLTNKALQEELKVTDAQKEKFKAIVEKNAETMKKRGASYKEKYEDAGKDKDKIAELRASQQKENEKDGEATRKSVEEQLTTDQKTRIKQIERQMGGVRGFLSEEVAKELSLTDEQKDKIKGLVTEYGKDVAEVMKDSGGSFKDGKFVFDKEKNDASQKKRDKLKRAALADIDDVLTADQRKIRKESLGEPFDTTKIFQFGPLPKKKD